MLYIKDDFYELDACTLNCYPQNLVSGKKEQGEFALDVAVKTLPFYNDYFEIPYPLPKMDLIAIPDFAAGIVYLIDF